MLLVAAGSAWAATLDRIKSTGAIALGYREGAAPFSFKDREGRVRGYSVDLCERVAAAIKKELGLADLKVTWKGVLAATRFDAVRRGDVDIECGTTTISLSRMADVDFSVPIFVDGGAVLTRVKAKVSHLVDLKGRKVAVIGGTTTEQALTRMLRMLDAQAQLVHVKDGEEGMRALSEGSVDGYAADRIVLTGLRQRSAESGEFELLPSDFSYEPYALVVRRDDPDFRLAVNRALVGVYRSGEIDGIFQRWLGGLGRPGELLHAMFYLNTLPE